MNVNNNKVSKNADEPSDPSVEIVEIHDHSTIDYIKKIMAKARAQKRTMLLREQFEALAAKNFGIK